jgi:hypothetical protein
MLTCCRSAVIDNLSSRLDGTESLAYFYCKFDVENQRMASSIFGTYLKQLCIQGSERLLPPAVTDEYRWRKNSGFSSGDLDLNGCVEILLKLLWAKRQLYLILDGLDECPVHDRRLILKTIRRMFHSSITPIKALIVSREDKDIALILVELPSFSVDAKANAADVAHYIREEIRLAIQDKRILKGDVPEELQRDIIQSLTSNADGM